MVNGHQSCSLQKSRSWQFDLDMRCAFGDYVTQISEQNWAGHLIQRILLCGLRLILLIHGLTESWVIMRKVKDHAKPVKCQELPFPVSCVSSQQSGVEL